MTRLERDAWIACALLATGALVVAPERPQVALGVVGGAVLMAFSYRAILAGVSGVGVAGAAPPRRAAVLVKFFTRHVILALAAYGMMTRLHLDPIGMLAGVATLSMAAAAEAARALWSGAPPRARR
jgi:hypothetical protein